jgi:hypothetical protein
MNCKDHPMAPHGFLRQASHDAGRYVCECEWWDEKDYELATLEERRVMGYKSKTCPKCNAVHNKRGEFCSRSCGNTSET